MAEGPRLLSVHANDECVTWHAGFEMCPSGKVKKFYEFPDLWSRDPWNRVGRIKRFR